MKPDKISNELRPSVFWWTLESACPRYHFDLRDGDAFAGDEEGVELLDIESAQIEAAGSWTGR
jgi:hypothetical protein